MSKWQSSTRIVTASMLAAGILAAAASASAAVSVGDALGTSEAEVRAALEAQGYVVEEIELKAGTLEVEAAMDDKEVEFVVGLQSGSVTEAETEDADDDNDADDSDDDADDGEDDADDGDDDAEDGDDSDDGDDGDDD